MPRKERMSKERPILFNSEMVRAILDGRKIQTRRVIKPQPRLPLVKTYGGYWRNDYSVELLDQADASQKWNCPYGKIGDRLWVRETFRPYSCGYDSKTKSPVEYKAAMFNSQSDINWKSSRYMPKWAARIWLEITGIRVERVQDIDAVEAEAEGMRRPKRLCPDRHDEYILERFQRLWDSINTKRGFGWDENPWVWVIEFKRIEDSNAKEI